MGEGGLAGGDGDGEIKGQLDGQGMESTQGSQGFDFWSEFYGRGGLRWIC